jgi:hypothetical protein
MGSNERYRDNQNFKDDPKSHLSRFFLKIILCKKIIVAKEIMASHVKFARGWV